MAFRDPAAEEGDLPLGKRDRRARQRRIWNECRRNRSLQFRCESVFLKAATADSPFTNQIPEGKLLRVPVAHGEGCYFADGETLGRLRANNQILWQYANEKGELTETANPNGSLDNIAGICDPTGRVLGLMPHPERHVEATQHPLWTRRDTSLPADGLRIFTTAVSYFR